MQKIISYIPGKLAVFTYGSKVVTYRVEQSGDGSFQIVHREGNEADSVMSTGLSREDADRMLASQVDHFRYMGDVARSLRRSVLKAICPPMLATVAVAALIFYGPNLVSQIRQHAPAVSPSPVALVGDQDISRSFWTAPQEDVMKRIRAIQSVVTKVPPSEVAQRLAVEGLTQAEYENLVRMADALDEAKSLRLERDAKATRPTETENQIARLTQEVQDLRKQNETSENEVVRWRKEAETATAETRALNAQRASVEKLATDLATLVDTIEKSEAERAAQIAVPTSQPGMEEMTRRLSQIYANETSSVTKAPTAAQIPVVAPTSTTLPKPVEALQAPSAVIPDVSAGLGQVSNLDKGGPSFDDHAAMGQAVEDVAAATKAPARPVATDAPMTIDGIAVPVSGDTGIEGDGGANDPNERSNFKDSLALLPAKPEIQPSVTLPGGDVAGIESRSAVTDAQVKAAGQAPVNSDGRKMAEIEADRDVLIKARDALMSGQKLDPETIAKLPPEVALALQQKGAVLDPAQAVALETDGKVRAVTIPEAVARDYVNEDGFRTIPETNTWAATGGRLQLPPIGGGDILTADDFAMFDLRR